MKWWKRILQLFQKDVFKIKQTKKDDLFSKASPNKSYSQRNREVEGRVLFQYPKGQFRFPVIPDEKEPSPEKHKKNLSLRSKNDTVKKYDNQDDRNNIRRRTSKEQNNFTGPFQPTELPPPLYGLKREHFEEPIEYELTNLLQTEEYFDTNEQVTEDNVLAENHPLKADENFETTSNRLSLDEQQKSTAKKQCEKASSELTAQKVESSIEQPKQDVVKREVTGRTVSETAEEVPLEKEIQLENKSKQSRNEQVESSNKSKEHTRQLGKKKQIPFNVMMLKSDKRKLAKRRKQSTTKAFTNPVQDEKQRQVSETNNRSTKMILEKKEKVNHSQSNIVDDAVHKKLGTKSVTQEQNKMKNCAVLSNAKDQQIKRAYQFPTLDLLHPPVKNNDDSEWLGEQRQILNETLKNFHVQAKVVNVTKGPAVTRFEVQPELGVKVNKITNLADDIKLSLAARDIRIEAPIPGKHTIGIEVPNKSSRPVLISEIIGNEVFEKHPSSLSVALGLDISGQPVITDLRKMPHGLIAGATGSGKSVCINTMIISLLYKANPNEVKLLLIDPKMVELAPYNQIPHLISPVITDVKAATASLKWAVEEMERRYQLFASAGARDISRYNQIVSKQYETEKLPYIVIIIDELADLMMMSPADVEEAICRIAQKARACGIHLLIATQRPSVDVITGLIKANIPTRIAFSVSSQVDSRTIIDISGAERLLGRGDMLFLENGASKPIRLQGTFVSDDEVDEVVAYVRKQQAPNYLFEQNELLQQTQMNESEDELFDEACAFIVQQGAASTSSLQRRFRIGYNRAARLIDLMEQQGFISEARGSRPREVFISEYDLEKI